MTNRGPQRIWWIGLPGLCLLCFAMSMAWSQDVPNSDPVENLREALQLEVEKKPNPFSLDFRSKNLEKKINALKTIGDLRRALSLDEWREDVSRPAEFQEIDLIMRREIGNRLKIAVKYVVDHGDADTRLAVANMISEMGATVRAVEIKDRGGFARSLLPEVIELCKKSDVGIRQEALRALGNINPDPEQAAAMFKFVLKKDRPEIRLIAAQGLGQMMSVVNQLRDAGALVKSGSRVDATNADVIRTAHEVVPTCQVGLKDVEPRVRSACLDGIRIAAESLANQRMIRDPFERKKYPPDGRQLTKEETQEIVDDYDTVRGEVDEVKPFFELLRETAPSLTESLSDGETSVRLSAVGALEMIAQARFMQRKRLESVPLPDDVKGKINLITLDDPLTKFLPKGLKPMVKLISDPDVRIRRSVLDFLQDIDRDAKPAIPDLIPALSDPDRFIRWSAVRIISKLPAKDVVEAIPGVGKLLADDDPAIRQVAANALVGIGALSRGALPSIYPAILEGDAESRLALFEVIKRLDPKDGATTVPNLIKVLANDDARIRRGAAETLARLGGVAIEAIPALRRLIGDYDPDVRRAASDAILSIKSAAGAIAIPI